MCFEVSEALSVPNKMKVLCSDKKVREIDIYDLAGDLTMAWFGKLDEFLESKHIEVPIINLEALALPSSHVLQMRLYAYLNALTRQSLEELRQKKLSEYELVAKELGIEVEEGVKDGHWFPGIGGV